MKNLIRVKDKYYQCQGHGKGYDIEIIGLYQNLTLDAKEYPYEMVVREFSGISVMKLNRDLEVNLDENHGYYSLQEVETGKVKTQETEVVFKVYNEDGSVFLQESYKCEVSPHDFLQATKQKVEK